MTYGREMFTMRHPDVPEDECYCNADRGVKCLNCVHAGIVEKARLDERDAVVAFLRHQHDNPPEHLRDGIGVILTEDDLFAVRQSAYSSIADAIEQGCHA